MPVSHPSDMFTSFFLIEIFRMSFPDQIPYRRWFPWLNLFQAIEIALSIRQLVVAAGAIAVFSLSHQLFDRIGPESSPSFQMEIQIGTRPASQGAFLPSRESVNFIALPWLEVLHSAERVIGPFGSSGRAVSGATLEIPRKSPSMVSIGVLVWHVIVWTLFGLILCRLSARRFAKGENGSFRKGVQFGLTRWGRGMVAPLIPIAAATLILVGMVVGSGVAWVLPVINLIAIAVFAPFLLVGGMIAGFLLVATLLGWPLMVAAIAYDDCDGFGGLSRSYSQWTGRPWYFVWCWIVVATAGLIALTIAGWLGEWTFYLCSVSIEQGMGNNGSAAFGRRAIQFLIQLLMHAYAISFFWTSATIVYALLRQSVDWMPCDSMSPDDDERQARDPLPVVGIPAMEPPAPTT